jgi:hypothetical protein
MMEMTDLERNLYGVSLDYIRASYMNSITARMCGLEMVVMSILSDCQEMMSIGHSNDSIRKQMNIAKFILSEMMLKVEMK